MPDQIIPNKAPSGLSWKGFTEKWKRWDASKVTDSGLHDVSPFWYFSLIFFVIFVAVAIYKRLLPYIFIWSSLSHQGAADPPDHVVSASHLLTSLEGTLEPFLRDHQLSTMAMRQESTTPAARTQKTPAKLWMSRALLRCRVCTELYRSQGLSLGHHFSFSMSMSPFCWSSKILRMQKETRTADHEQRFVILKTTYLIQILKSGVSASRNSFFLKRKCMES